MMVIGVRLPRQAKAGGKQTPDEWAPVLPRPAAAFSAVLSINVSCRQYGIGAAKIKITGVTCVPLSNSLLMLWRAAAPSCVTPKFWRAGGKGHCEAEEAHRQTHGPASCRSRRGAAKTIQQAF